MSGARPSRAGGFSLAELLVALVVLEIGLGAALGLAALAARDLARAAELQRAVGALDVVADSLLGLPAPAPGERSVGAHRVRWGSEAGTLRVRVMPAGGSDRAIVSLDLPVAP